MDTYHYSVWGAVVMIDVGLAQAHPNYTAAPSTRVRNSQLDATTEQNADLDPE